MSRVVGLSQIRTLFNIGKKFVDILDDLWSTLRGVLPAETIRIFSPFVLGIVGFITHFGEGIQGAREAYRAYKNEKIGQRKTRIVSSVLTFMLSGAGLGLATALIVSAMGAAISGATMILAPVLIPGFLTAIYSLALWRKAYVFSKAKEEEAKAKFEYEQCFSEIPLDDLQVQTAREEKKKKFEMFREERLRAERDLAFNVIEVATSALVVTATILGTAAIVGASVASLGALPVVMLMVGVVGGVACKLLEYYDEKNNFNFSRRLRAWFTDKWEKPANTHTRTSENALSSEARDGWFKGQGKKTMSSSLIQRRLAEENMIELTPLKKPVDSRVLAPEVAGHEKRASQVKRKSPEALDPAELASSHVKRLKI